MACKCEFQKKLLTSGVEFNPVRSVYLDYNATTPVEPATLGAFERICRNIWGNPSSLHSAGVKAWESMETARKNIGSYFGVKPDNLLFCGSGSEAIHAGIYGITAREPDRVIVTTEIEHQAVLNTAQGLLSEKKGAVQGCTSAGRDTDVGSPAKAPGMVTLGVDRNGGLLCEQLEKTVKKFGKILLILSPVNHETGSCQPIHDILSILKNYDAIVFADGVQAALRMPPSRWVPYCSMFAISSHKLYAPKGVGLLFRGNSISLTPFRYGGNQEDGLFPGTENTPGIAALSASIDIIKKRFQEESLYISVLSREGISILTNSSYPCILESPENAAPGILCVSLPWVNDMENLLFTLNQKSICISRFSACTVKATGPSGVLLAMGRPLERAEKSLRISLGRWSKREDFHRLDSVLKMCFKQGI
ncbi:MAG: aminotransferase class V-fold PLP-dependent enzyme [Spirochaetota bacterium]